VAPLCGIMVTKMPTRSKFTADRRHLILELLRAGASRREAARMAGLDHSTLIKWIRRGRKAAPGGRWREFYLDVISAETPRFDFSSPRPTTSWAGIRSPRCGSSSERNQRCGVSAIRQSPTALP
jgi:hypothetical protein